MQSLIPAIWLHHHPLHGVDSVHLQRPCVTRKIETWLSDSRVGNIVWLTTEADDQSSLYYTTASTDVMSDHIGRRDASHGGGCSKTSAHTGQFGRASTIWSISSVVALRRKEGSATLLSTGSHDSCAGCRQLEIRRTALWSWVSMRSV